MTQQGYEVQEVLLAREILLYAAYFVGALFLMVFGFWAYNVRKRKKTEEAKAKTLFNHGERKNGINGSHGKF